MRQSLLVPIAELELAAKLLDAAADALLLQRVPLARELVHAANFPAITDYARRLVGAMTLDVHRRTRRPQCLPKAERDPARMRTPSGQAAVFARDGWRCRYCGIKVICKSARSVFTRIVPIPAAWTSVRRQGHSALYALASSLDHVVPHGRGGRNEDANFVTACYGCQFGRGEWTLDEVQVTDPRGREPVIDSWDGLRRLVGRRGSAGPKSMLCV